MAPLVAQRCAEVLRLQASARRVGALSVGGEQVGGQSGQEIRNWIAADAALSTTGPYDITYRYYRPIPEFIAGFSVTTALPRTAD